MEKFKYTTRNYVPNVDLNALGKSFDTLEQGHKEAVSTASELETAIASLDMDPKEDSFKEELINDIKTTIDDNTIYGNSYSALNDLILKRGNIFSDGRVIGRLRNNAAKKEYDTKVDSMNIPEGMKQMYKEKNPYEYKEGVYDKRTGRTAPGEMWTPKSEPVNTVPASTIQTYALQIASKNAGSNEFVTFLDANDKPTPDPTKSKDGHIYYKKGNRYELLPKDKVIDSYKVAITSIPGAEDSLRQDYEYANYERKKIYEQNKKNGIDTAPNIEGLTDKNGNIYMYDQWLENKMSKFGDAAAYSHNYSSIDYGTALQNRFINNDSGAVNVGVDPNGFGTFIAGTKETEGNSFAGAKSAQKAANEHAVSILKNIDGKRFSNMNNISDLYKELANKNIADTPEKAIKYIIDNYNDKLSNEDKIKITNSFIGYTKATEQIDEMLKKAGADQDALKFSSDLSDGIFSNDNKYSSRIINWLNDYYINNKTAEFTVGSDILQGIAKSYKTDIAGLKNEGFNIIKHNNSEYSVIIDANHRNLLPKFASTIRSVNKVIPGNIGGFLKNTFTKNVDKSNYKYVDKLDPSNTEGNSIINTNENITGGKYNRGYNMLHLADIYDNAVEAAANVEKKVGVSKGYVTFHGIDEGSFSALWHRENAKSLGYTDAILNKKIEMANERVDNMFANGNFDSGSIEILDDAGNAIEDISLNQEAKIMLQKMYRSDTYKKQIKRDVMIPTGGNMGQPKGYIVGFTVPEDIKSKHFKAGQNVTFVVKGIIEEEINYDPSYNPNVLANNIIQTSKSTNGTINNIGYDKNFGDTRLIPKNDGKYYTNIMGSDIELNDKDAENVLINMITLEQLKSQYLNGVYSDSEDHLKQLQDALGVVINNISNVIKQDYDDVELIVGNYFLDIE